MLFHGYLSFFSVFRYNWEKIFLFSKLVAVYKPKLKYSYIHQVFLECA